MLTLMCDLQREPPDLGEMPPAPPGETLDLRAMIAGVLGSMAGRSASLARAGPNR